MSKTGTIAKPKMLFVVTEDWYFCSHRLPLALAAIEAGMEVAIATRVAAHGETMRAAGIAIHPWDISRGATGVWGELQTVYRLFKIYRAVKPDLVHQVALKPVLYGSLVAKLTGVRNVVNALGGMGFVFNGGAGRPQWLRTLIVTGMRWLLTGRHELLILQNPDDVELMVSQAKIKQSSIRLIRGAGVDVDQFCAEPASGAPPMVMLPARMLWDKGIGEYVEAARMLKAKGVALRCVLVGGIDECNPSAIPQRQLQAWQDEGVVEWFGRRDDMPEVYRQADIVCLPSYREGLPKALLEAASCSRPIVATDVPGCREIVVDGVNGMLVAAREVAPLAAALETLAADAALRLRMGQAGRDMVVREFSEQYVVDATLAVYRELLPPAQART
ncbi:MAG: glycosyltransferase family 4 protein [Pseudomonadota bacterium]